MRPRKTFDCVEMKDRIHARLEEKWQGLTDEEIRAAIARELNTSDAPVARWWRAVAAKTAPTPIAGDPVQDV
jgi:hypothetical protein